MQNLNAKIIRPTFLLDKAKCITNIESMLAKAQRNNTRLRPHFKTHQSAAIGAWFKERGVEDIAVSSMEMAVYFANAGWKDITLAIPINVREIDSINELASKIQLNLVVESQETIRFLQLELKHAVGVFIKVDTGYHRSGVPAEATGSICLLVDLMKESDKLDCKGFLAHTGHNYQAADQEEIHKNHSRTLLALNELKDVFRKDIPEIQVSLGDTPACSISEEFYGIDEIRPGNFVFYDIMQYVLGSCDENQIAVAMACPVIARNIDRNELVIHGGGVHFSKEYLEADDEGTKLFGSIVRITDNGWSEILGGGFLASLSQEHGIIRCSDELFDEFGIGDLIGILPVHSCMTANLMRRFMTTEGEWIETMNS
ncbi:alanine racemase [Labilibaculum filiforme]|uniref:Alanine racemase n=1 Tax=Labilibaculum filiforme TaxID=1940526 RepID=A0A2N3I433_9BACT|nr:alanine racemase [Labilibaculum filiforme]PKQ65065.1 alanine racemase [Labilibaculum filiforme]